MVESADDNTLGRGEDAGGAHLQRGIGEALDVGDADEVGAEGEGAVLDEAGELGIHEGLLEKC
jgi:hypothetical protein